MIGQVLSSTRWRASLLTALGGFVVSAILLLTAAGPANAGESNFCWGHKFTATWGQPGYTCSDPTSRYLTGVYGQGSQGQICAGAGVISCSNDPTWGVYVPQDGTLFNARILNGGTAPNTVYGHTWWNTSPPPPPPSPPPPPPPPLTITGTAAVQAGSHFNVYAIGSNGHLRQKWCCSGSRSGWSEWWDMGTPSGALLATAPSSAQTSSGYTNVYAGDTMGLLYQTRSLSGINQLDQLHTSASEHRGLHIV